MKIKEKKVVDAAKPLMLTITTDDVKRGTVKMPNACAAAVAAVRQCKGALSARVHLSRTYVEFPNKIVRYATPNALRVEIVSFDRGKKFEAGTYKLNPLPASDRTGARQGGPDNPKRIRHPEKEGWSRRPIHEITGVRAHAPKASNWK